MLFYYWFSMKDVISINVLRTIKKGHVGQLNNRTIGLK